MPIRVEGLETAYTLHVDNTWKYLCRECMKEGKDVEMGAYIRPTQQQYTDEIWIRCPRCGAKERIGVSRQ